jgi:hypothetical protein
VVEELGPVLEGPAPAAPPVALDPFDTGAGAEQAAPSTIPTMTTRATRNAVTRMKPPSYRTSSLLSSRAPRRDIRCGSARE